MISNVLDKVNADTIFRYIVEYGLKIGAAILIFAAGWFAIKLINRWIKNMMIRREIDPSLAGFILSLVRTALKVLLFVTVIQMIGVTTTSFVAILGAAGLAIGLALQGTLGNFAGGVIILLLKPFRVGDFIDAQNHTGTVFSIELFTTVLKTTDNKTVIIPNGPLANGNIVNYTHEATRRVDWTFSMGYGNDVDQANKILQRLMDEDPRIFNDPAPFVGLTALADSSVNFAVRAWTKTEDYWDVYFAMNKRVYETFPKEGLSIPFPQMDVYVHKPTGA